MIVDMDAIGRVLQPIGDLRSALLDPDCLADRQQRNSADRRGKGKLQKADPSADNTGNCIAKGNSENVKKGKSITAFLLFRFPLFHVYELENFTPNSLA